MSTTGRRPTTSRCSCPSAARSAVAAGFVFVVVVVIDRMLPPPSGVSGRGGRKPCGPAVVNDHGDQFRQSGGGVDREWVGCGIVDGVGCPAHRRQPSGGGRMLPCPSQRRPSFGGTPHGRSGGWGLGTQGCVSPCHRARSVIRNSPLRGDIIGDRPEPIDRDMGDRSASCTMSQPRQANAWSLRRLPTGSTRAGLIRDSYRNSAARFTFGLLFSSVCDIMTRRRLSGNTVNTELVHAGGDLSTTNYRTDVPSRRTGRVLAEVVVGDRGGVVRGRRPPTRAGAGDSQWGVRVWGKALYAAMTVLVTVGLRFGLPVMRSAG